MPTLNRFIIAFVLALLTMKASPAADNPVYSDGLLTLPSVDSPTVVAKYQDAVFKLTDQGTWQLLDVKTIGTLGYGHLLIEKVELVRADTFPVQIFLRLTGWLSNCLRLMHTSQRLNQRTFEVAIPTKLNYDPRTQACAETGKDYVKIVPLPVYGLSAGDYSYEVYTGGLLGSHKGTFMLSADNKFPGDQ